MSFQNKPEQKTIRRDERFDRKGLTPRAKKDKGKLPYCGLIVDRATIKVQRYLAARNLPHSPQIASILI